MQRHIFYYYQAGLSIVPLSEGKSAVDATEYMRHRATPDEVLSWWGVNVNGSNAYEIYYKTENRYGVGIICGAISGNLAVLDFQDAELFKRLFLALSAHTTADREGFVPMSYHFMGKAWVMRDEGVKVLLRIKETEVRSENFGGVKVLGSGSVIVAPPSAVSSKHEVEWRTDITNPILAISPTEFTMLKEIVEKVSRGEELVDDDFSVSRSLFSELGFSDKTPAKKKLKKEVTRPGGQNPLTAFLDEVKKNEHS